MNNTVKVIVIIVFMIVILVLNWLVGSYTDKAINNMEAGVAQLKKTLLAGNYEESKKQSEKLRDNWNEYENKFAYFMDHEEIEKLSVKVYAIDENASNKYYELALEDSIETKFLLEHVKDKLKWKLNNVF